MAVKTRVILLLLGVLVSTSVGCYFFRSTEIESSGLEEFTEQIKAVDCDNSDRFSAVEKLFDKVGTSWGDKRIEEFPGVKNVVLTIRGKSEETIVVGAHYDKTTLGCGAIDNWTGVVVVANLYAAFRNHANEKTIKFVAFDKEERGLVGSKAMVGAINDADKDRYCAMVNLDSFGFADTWVFGNISDPRLTEFARETAKKRNAEFAVKNFPGASADSKSFLNAGIPAITLSGLNNNWRKYLHKRTDQLEKIKFTKVYENYLFSIEFLKRIDSEPCR